MDDGDGTIKDGHKETFTGYTRHVLIALSIIVVAPFLWKIASVLLLAFAGVLLGVILRGAADRINKYVPMGEYWALGTVMLLTLLLIAAAGWWLGPRLVQQFQQFIQTLPNSINQLQQELQRFEQLQGILEYISSQLRGIVSGIAGAASAILTAVLYILLVLGVGIYLAVSPEMYKNGITHLVPYAQRERVHEFLDTAGYALWLWLTGQLVSMLIVGVLVTVGLWLIGVPLPLVLGLIAGIFDFVPYIGPIAAAIPGVLIAFTQGPTTALYTVLLYFVVQQIEGNIVEPLVQSHMVSLSPALVILAAVAMGLVFGVLGVILAVPLLVVIMVAIKMFYVEDVLGDPMKVPHKSE